MSRKNILLIGFMLLILGSAAAISTLALRKNTPDKPIVISREALAVQMTCIYGLESACETFAHDYEHTARYMLIPDYDALAAQMACIYGHVESACETFARKYEHSPMRYTLVPDNQALAVQMACIYGHVESACDTFARDYEHRPTVFKL